MWNWWCFCCCFSLLGMLIFFFHHQHCCLFASSLTEFLHSHGDKNFQTDDFDLTVTLTFTVNCESGEHWHQGMIILCLLIALEMLSDFSFQTCISRLRKAKGHFCVVCYTFCCPSFTGDMCTLQHSCLHLICP